MAEEKAKNDPMNKNKQIKHIKVSSVTLANILKMDRINKLKKRKRGRPRKIKEDPNEEDLADYNEWYNLQKGLQMELIAQIDKEAAKDYQKEEEVSEQASDTEESEDEGSKP